MSEIETPQLVLFKVGILCSEPDGFAEALNQELLTEHVSAEQIRAEVQAQYPNEKSGKIGSLVVDRILDRTEELLSAGEDIFVDKYCMTEISRGEVIDLAQDFGAAAVALIINTPFSTIKRRVYQKQEENGFITPTDQWQVKPMRAMYTMINQWEDPNNRVDQVHEDIDCVIRLNGNIRPHRMVQDVQRELDNEANWLEPANA